MVGSHCKPQQFQKNSQAFHAGCCCYHALLRIRKAWSRQQPESWMEAWLYPGSYGIGEIPHSLKGIGTDHRTRPEDQASMLPEFPGDRS